jgi:CspA family cold shock protein
MTGKIRTLNAGKGFGFITSDEGPDYFFHRSALKNLSFDQLYEGMVVNFEVGDSPRGPRAENVEVIE